MNDASARGGWGMYLRGIVTVQDLLDFAAVEVSSQAIARWLWPAVCQARTVCSRNAPAGGTPWRDAATGRSAAASADVLRSG